jgi:hypothetical protein
MPHAHWDDPNGGIINLLLQFRYIPHDKAPESCRWSIDAEYDHIGDNYRVAEQPFREEVEDCIRSVCTDQPHNELSPEAQYFLGVRASVLQEFVISLGISRGSPIKTVFLHPPDMTFQETVQWLLLDWWDTFGAMEATKSRIVDLYYDIQ